MPTLHVSPLLKRMTYKPGTRSNTSVSNMPSRRATTMPDTLHTTQESPVALRTVNNEPSTLHVISAARASEMPTTSPPCTPNARVLP